MFMCINLLFNLSRVTFCVLEVQICARIWDGAAIGDLACDSDFLFEWSMPNFPLFLEFSGGTQICAYMAGSLGVRDMRTGGGDGYS